MLRVDTSAQESTSEVDDEVGDWVPRHEVDKSCFGMRAWPVMPIPIVTEQNVTEKVGPILKYKSIDRPKRASNVDEKGPN